MQYLRQEPKDVKMIYFKRDNESLLMTHPRVCVCVCVCVRTSCETNIEDIKSRISIELANLQIGQHLEGPIVAVVVEAVAVNRPLSVYSHLYLFSHVSGRCYKTLF